MIFESDLPSIIADFPKEHNSSSSSSFLSSAEKKYWLVGECLQVYLVLSKQEEHIPAILFKMIERNRVTMDVTMTKIGNVQNSG